MKLHQAGGGHWRKNNSEYQIEKAGGLIIYEEMER